MNTMYLERHFYVVSGNNSSIISWQISQKLHIRQAFIRQKPAYIRAHLATTPDSTSLESPAILAEKALASETDVKDSSVGVAEARVNEIRD